MERADVHRLVDQLPERTLAAVARMLEVFRRVPEPAPEPAPLDPQHAEALAKEPGDPLLLALARAPLDEEPLTPEDIAALEEVRAESARGESIPWEQVKAELGLDDGV